jgi:hypothetical protein
MGWLAKGQKANAQSKTKHENKELMNESSLIKEESNNRNVYGRNDNTNTSSTQEVNQFSLIANMLRSR